MYWMTMLTNSTNFFMKKENLKPAYEALVAAEKNFLKENHCNVEHFCPRSTLSQELDALGWSLQFDANGDVMSIYFDSDAMSNEKVWLKAIAPYVAEGSHIDMYGDDEVFWTWRFDGKDVSRYDGRVVFYDQPRLSDNEII